MDGDAGLPSLDAQRRGRGKHPLSKTMSSGADAEEAQTFGYLESGFRAAGLELYAFDAYRALLEKHAGHRLFLWADEEDPESLPRELRNPDGLRWLKYKEPRAKDGYVHRGILISCAKCDDEFASDVADWVKPFPRKQLEKDQVTILSATTLAFECAAYEVEPFGMILPDLGDWLSEHKGHRPTISLHASITESDAPAEPQTVVKPVSAVERIDFAKALMDLRAEQARKRSSKRKPTP